MNKILQGDCLISLKGLEDNSVDSIVTDPPYELGFMGKSWDSTGIANDKNMWAECLRVLKPGGHLLAFSGTRTYHRMAVAIEDAGFEVRDMIEWVYGSGFPKSLNIGKAVDKINGESGRMVKFTQWMRTTGMKASEANRILQDAKLISENGTVAGHYFAKDKDGQPAIPTSELWNELRPHIKIEIPKWVDELVDRIEAEREVIGKQTNIANKGNNNDGRYNWNTESQERKESIDITAPATEQAKKYEGWGTALKPAHEPICMARKPLAEKTVAENVLKYGTGGINIDDSRVGTEVLENGYCAKKQGYMSDEQGASGGAFSKDGMNIAIGRFPANLIHDNSEEVRECFPESTSGAKKANQENYNHNGKEFVATLGASVNEYQASSGNASRFFKSIIYKSKASKRDRGEGNIHPTVKSVALMEYLIKMITPKGGIVLDPFAGSGSTLVAAKQNGFQYIGCELDSEYIKIAEARLEAVKQQVKLL